MEIWLVRICKFCQGVGVQAVRPEYEKWRNAMLTFIKKTCAREKLDDRTLAAMVVRFSNQFTKNRKKCSWCEGKGIFKPELFSDEKI